jgi:hypothetical protein
MIYYRFPLLLTICLTGLVFLPSNSRGLMAASSSVKLSPLERVAQATATDTTLTASSAYDRYMKEGYAATNRKDYETALNAFQKALQERPGDRYAQQALQNVQVYREQSNFLWLIFGLAGTAVALAIALIFVFWRLRRREKPDKIGEFARKNASSKMSEQDSSAPIFSFAEPGQESNNHQVASNQKQEDYPPPKEASLEPALVVQETTRLPNLDLIEALMQDLQEPDPKKRRKAIWELAQKSDSRAMKPLVDLMIDTDSQERSLILEALSQISSRTLKPMNQALAISLQDKNPQVRKNAIRDLTRIYDVMSQISQMLCHAIDDNDSEVKETAKWALNQLNLQMPPRLDLVSRPKTPSVTVEQSYTESAER